MLAPAAMGLKFVIASWAYDYETLGCVLSCYFHVVGDCLHGCLFVVGLE